jgi:hypothetical protein
VADSHFHIWNPQLSIMSTSLPFRPHDDPEQDAREEGDNDDDEEDIDESVRSGGSPIISI